MGFLSMFKRKPGGTLFGNMLRGVAKAVPFVGGMLGNGAMMISQESADNRDALDAFNKGEAQRKIEVEKEGGTYIPKVAPANLSLLKPGIFNDQGKMQVGSAIAGAYDAIVTSSASNGVIYPGAITNGKVNDPYSQGAKDTFIQKYGVMAGVVAGILVVAAIVFKMFKK